MYIIISFRRTNTATADDACQNNVYVYCAVTERKPKRKRGGKACQTHVYMYTVCHIYTLTVSLHKSTPTKHAMRKNNFHVDNNFLQVPTSVPTGTPPPTLIGPSHVPFRALRLAGLGEASHTMNVFLFICFCFLFCTISRTSTCGSWRSDTISSRTLSMSSDAIAHLCIKHTHTHTHTHTDTYIRT